MIHSKRKPLHKAASARKFGKNVGRAHPFNVAAKPMRGGFRL